MSDFAAARLSLTAAAAAAERTLAFLRSVYGWMFVGLGVTALVAYLNFINLFLILLRFTGARRA